MPEPMETTINMDLVKAIIDLRDAHNDAKAACEEIYKELRERKSELLEQFIASGTSQVRTDKGLVFVSSTKRYSVAQDEQETPEQAIERAAGVLNNAGLDYLIQVTTDIKCKELLDRLDELEQLGEEVDPTLVALVRTSVFTDIRVRK